MADSVLTALGGGAFEPPLYLPIALDFAAHEVLGVFVESRRFHGVLATGVLGIGLTWSPVAS
ncbi:MAG: hypothetical protein OXU33_10240 [Gemmatimonadota bacterium]|nr:hypothetical protein [Gemmatimonadota bacterium]